MPQDAEQSYYNEIYQDQYEDRQQEHYEGTKGE